MRNVFLLIYVLLTNKELVFSALPSISIKSIGKYLDCVIKRTLIVRHICQSTCPSVEMLPHTTSFLHQNQLFDVIIEVFMAPNIDCDAKTRAKNLRPKAQRIGHVDRGNVINTCNNLTILPKFCYSFFSLVVF